MKKLWRQVKDCSMTDILLAIIVIMLIVNTLLELL